MRPDLQGLSHLSLSVADTSAAQRFWSEVMGFEVISEESAYCFLLDRGAGLAVFITNHEGTVKGTFDEHRVGLDHLAYAVPDLESLLSWQQRLDGFGVAHSGIVESDAGHHLNLRAPDAMPVELYVMSPSFAQSLSLDGAAPVAATHR